MSDNGIHVLSGKLLCTYCLFGYMSLFFACLRYMGFFSPIVLLLGLPTCYDNCEMGNFMFKVECIYCFRLITHHLRLNIIHVKLKH